MLSLLDDKWCSYSEAFIERMAGDDRPWFLYHCTRGAHFDNYPHPDFLGRSPAKHPYKDALIELDDICGRLVEALERTGQLDSTMVVISSDNGPEMETWPDSAFTPFRCAKGSTWEGGVRVPAVVSWPGMIEPGRASDGIVHLLDLFATCATLAGAADRLPTDRYLDTVDQTSFLLAPADEGEVVSNRKFQHYWLTAHYSAVRVGEYKYMLTSITDNDTDVLNPGGFTGSVQHYGIRTALQPLPRSEGVALVHDPQARVHRRDPRRDHAPPAHVPRLAEQAALRRRSFAVGDARQGRERAVVEVAAEARRGEQHRLHRAAGVDAQALFTGLDVEHDDRVGHARRVVVVRDELSGVGEQQRMARVVLLAPPPRRGAAVGGDVERGEHAVAAVVAHDDAARLVDDGRVRDQAVRQPADLGERRRRPSRDRRGRDATAPSRCPARGTCRRSARSLRRCRGTTRRRARATASHP